MLGFDRPHYSLKLGPHQAVWAEAVKNWRGRLRAGLKFADLPPGLLTPSPVDPNITDVEAFSAHLRAVIGAPAGRPPAPRNAVLVLPDLCVRAHLLDVDAMPAKARERDAFIRWRLQKDSGLPAAGVRIAWRPAGHGRVLAAVMAEAVLRQYETVCEGLGIIPVRIAVTSFLMQPPSGRRPDGSEATAWLGLLDRGFTFLIREGDRPVFLRIKAQSPDVAADVHASLASYEESRAGAPLRHLHVLGEGADADYAPVLARELGIEASAAGVDSLRRIWRGMLPDKMSAGALPAVAALAPEGGRDAFALDFGGVRHLWLDRLGAALALASVLLAGLIAWYAQDARALRTEAVEVERTAAAVREQDRRIQLEAQREHVDVSDAAIARIAGEAAFANDLIAKRSFSWTRFLGDLEEAVPAHVSVDTIRLDFKNALITIGGSSLTLKDLTGFITGLEDHRAFHDANLAQHGTRDNGHVDFSLTVKYRMR